MLNFTNYFYHITAFYTLIKIGETFFFFILSTMAPVSQANKLVIPFDAKFDSSKIEVQKHQKRFVVAGVTVVTTLEVPVLSSKAKPL